MLLRARVFVTSLGLLRTLPVAQIIGLGVVLSPFCKHSKSQNLFSSPCTVAILRRGSHLLFWAHELDWTGLELRAGPRSGLLQRGQAAVEQSRKESDENRLQLGLFGRAVRGPLQTMHPKGPSAGLMMELQVREQVLRSLCVSISCIHYSFLPSFLLCLSTRIS